MRVSGQVPRRRVLERRVLLQTELAEDLPPVIGDRVQLQQVILNLLRNASDAMLVSTLARARC
jgi:signal transduction histidine kinase